MSPMQEIRYACDETERFLFTTLEVQLFGAELLDRLTWNLGNGGSERIEAGHCRHVAG